MIKIDRSFTAGFPEDRRDSAVIGAVVSLAARLGVSVIAEGIETRAPAARSYELGCVTGQGFLFARPLPPAALAGLLSAQIEPRRPLSPTVEPRRPMLETAPVRAGLGCGEAAGPSHGRSRPA